MNAPLPYRLPGARKLLLPMRLDVSSVAKIELPNGDELLCTTEKLSRRELVLSCNQETLTRILPRRCTEPNKPCCVRASFSLPVESDSEYGSDRENQHIIECETVVFSARRVAQNRFLLQLRFTQLSALQAAGIATYIEQHKVGA